MAKKKVEFETYMDYGVDHYGENHPALQFDLRDEIGFYQLKPKHRRFIDRAVLFADGTRYVEGVADGYTMSNQQCYKGFLYPKGVECSDLDNYEIVYYNNGKKLPKKLIHDVVMNKETLKKYNLEEVEPKLRLYKLVQAVCADPYYGEYYDLKNATSLKGECETELFDVNPMYRSDCIVLIGFSSEFEWVERRFSLDQQNRLVYTELGGDFHPRWNLEEYCEYCEMDFETEENLDEYEPLLNSSDWTEYKIHNLLDECDMIMDMDPATHLHEAVRFLQAVGTYGMSSSSITDTVLTTPESSPTKVIIKSIYGTKTIVVDPYTGRIMSKYVSRDE